jgi:hypothetical protein
MTTTTTTTTMTLSNSITQSMVPSNQLDSHRRRVKYLSQAFLLGSHNSGSYYIGKNSAYPPEIAQEVAPEILKSLPGSIGIQFGVNWA